MATLTFTGDINPGAGRFLGVNMDNFNLGNLLGMDINDAQPDHLNLSGSVGGLFDIVTITGSGFVFDVNEQLSGGTIAGINWLQEQGAEQVASFNLTGLSVPAATGEAWFEHDALNPSAPTAWSNALAGADSIAGTSFADLLRGYAGGDTIAGMGGDDQIFGGDGDDVIAALGNASILDPTGHSFLRGEDGNDTLQGGDGFDDINGNKGEDSIDGGAGGGDWLVGGQGNDFIVSHASDDILYGNLGSDTLQGGSGDEIIRGGQADDSLSGGAGADWLSGDRGSDTITGGAGADIFHTFSGAGLDVVTDFNAAEGDRVQLDAGTTYTVSQVGADTVIDMGAGDQMVLQGVDESTLPDGWIFTR